MRKTMMAVGAALAASAAFAYGQTFPPSVATNVLYDAGPAFTSPKPEVIVPHKVYRLYRK